MLEAITRFAGMFERQFLLWIANHRLDRAGEWHSSGGCCKPGTNRRTRPHPRGDFLFRNYAPTPVVHQESPQSDAVSALPPRADAEEVQEPVRIAYDAGP